MANKGIQIKTIFGVAIPPRKKRDRGTGYTIRFVLTGWIPSKKNLHRAVIERNPVHKKLNDLFKNKKRISFTRKEIEALFDLSFAKIVNTKAYKDWEAGAVQVIRDQMASHLQRHCESKGLIYPIADCSIAVYNYWKDKHSRDTINKMESILDVLVKAKCISDDDYFTLTPIIGDAETLPDDTLIYHITTIDITVYPKPQMSSPGN